MPLYGFLLVTLMGEKAYRPEVCQGIDQFPTPCSIAVIIASVTVRYTSRFSVALLSEVDIRETHPFAMFRGHAGLASGKAPSILMVDSLYKSSTRTALRIHLSD